MFDLELSRFSFSLSSLTVVVSVLAIFEVDFTRLLTLTSLIKRLPLLLAPYFLEAELGLLVLCSSVTEDARSEWVVFSYGITIVYFCAADGDIDCYTYSGGRGKPPSYK